MFPFLNRKIQEGRTHAPPQHGLAFPFLNRKIQESELHLKRVMRGSFPFLNRKIQEGIEAYVLFDPQGVSIPQ